MNHSTLDKLQSPSDYLMDGYALQKVLRRINNLPDDERDFLKKYEKQIRNLKAVDSLTWLERMISELEHIDDQADRAELCEEISLFIEHLRQDETLTQPSQSQAAQPGDGHTPIVVAIVPAYNEERFIASVVFTTRHYATHIIVVDDGSADRTAELAEAAGAMVVRMVQNGGKAEALNAGFRAAKQLKPDVVVCLDGDAQHEPAEIPNLISPVLAGEADVVIGSRFLEVKSKIPKWRQVGQHTLTAVTNTLSGVHVTDSQSGYRAFSPAAIEALKFRTGGLSLESEMQFLFNSSQLRVTEVPVSVNYMDGNKRNPVVHGLQVLDAMLSLVARRRPLLFISLPGAFLSCIGVILGVIVSLKVEQSGELMTGTAILTVLLILVGLVLSMSGVMLHSMGRLVSRLREEIKNISSPGVESVSGLNHSSYSVSEDTNDRVGFQNKKSKVSQWN